MIDCIHRGERLSETVPCPDCPRPDGSAGTVQLKLWACALHGRCAPRKQVDGVACCAGCPDRQTGA